MSTETAKPAPSNYSEVTPDNVEGLTQEQALAMMTEAWKDVQAYDKTGQPDTGTTARRAERILGKHIVWTELSR